MVGIFTAASIPLWAAGISAAGGIASGLMSGGGSGGTQYATQQSRLPGWVEENAMKNYGDITKASYDMPGPYTGQRVAGMTPDQLGLIQGLTNNVNSTTPAFNFAQANTNALMGYDPGKITPQMLSGTSLQPYMDPYIKNVIDPSMALLEQQRRQGLNQIGDQAVQSKAFGGSRQGITEGATNAQTNLLAGQLGGQLYGQAFGNAQNMAVGDITRDMQAQQQNVANSLLGAQFRGNMAQQYGNLATQGQNAWLTGLTNALTGQGMLQQQNQQELDAQKALYEEQRMDPIQRIQMRMAALSNSPYGQQTTSSGPGPTTNPWMTGLGTTATVAGLLGKFGAFGGGTNSGGGMMGGPSSSMGTPGSSWWS